MPSPNGMKRYCLGVAIAVAFASGCGDSPVEPGTPAEIFDEVWSRFDADYPFFPIAGVDWQAKRTIYRDSVIAAATDAERAQLLGRMIGSLKDYHTSLTTPFGVFGPPPIPYPHNFVPSILQQNYFASPIKFTPTTKINYTILENGSGYIYIGSFAGEDWGNDIDVALNALGNVPSMIVDIRDNGGGNEAIARIVASRFYDTNHVYRLSRSRNGPGYSQLGSPVSTSIGPAGSRRFTGPTAVITNRFNGSSAEDFLLMMRVLPHVVVVGDTTLGLGSFPAEHELSNGWTLRVPRTAQSTPEGFVYQFTGLPPDIFVQWRQEDETARRDSYVDAAIAALSLANVAVGRSRLPFRSHSP